jgi:hypothetical protein
MKFRILGLALALTLTGCVTPFANLGMVSTQTQLRDGARFKKIGKCKFLDKKFFFFFYWDGAPTFEQAVRGCMEQHKNAAYISTATLSLYQNYWVFFMWSGIQAEGNVYGLVGNQTPVEETFRLVPSENGLLMASSTSSERVIPTLE